MRGSRTRMTKGPPSCPALKMQAFPSGGLGCVPPAPAEKSKLLSVNEGVISFLELYR